VCFRAGNRVVIRAEIRDVSQVHGVSELVESRAGNPVCCGPDVGTQGFRGQGVGSLAY